MLDLSKIEAGKMELDLSCFDLGLLLEHSATLVRERAQRHGLALDIEVGEGLDEWVADARKVKQVAVNLLSNAVKFTPNGGRVSVRARHLNGVNGDAGDWAEVSVSDTGVGIAPRGPGAGVRGVPPGQRRRAAQGRRHGPGPGAGQALRRVARRHGVARQRARPWLDVPLHAAAARSEGAAVSSVIMFHDCRGSSCRRRY